MLMRLTSRSWEPIDEKATRSSTGEGWADDENGTTRAQAQAFRRACAEFGLCRYLRELEGWSCKVPVNAKGYFNRPHFSVLPDCAIHPAELAEAREARARTAKSSRKTTDPASAATSGNGAPANTGTTQSEAIEAKLAMLRTQEVKQRLAGYQVCSAFNHAGRSGKSRTQFTMMRS